MIRSLGFTQQIYTLGSRVQGFGFRVFRALGSGFGVQGFGLRVWPPEFRLWGSGFTVWGLGFRFERLPGRGLQSLGEFRVWGLGCRVEGLGFRV